jgi:hypothetical protein
LAKISGGNFRGSEALSQPTRPAKNVVFAGEVILRGIFAEVRPSARPDAWLTLRFSEQLAVEIEVLAGVVAEEDLA